MPIKAIEQTQAIPPITIEVLIGLLQTIQHRYGDAVQVYLEGDVPIYAEGVRYQFYPEKANRVVIGKV